MCIGPLQPQILTFLSSSRDIQQLLWDGGRGVGRVPAETSSIKIKNVTQDGAFVINCIKQSRVGGGGGGSSFPPSFPQIV